MTRRNRFLITALLFCHQLLAGALVTTQLLAEDSSQPGRSGVPSDSSAVQTPSAVAKSPCAAEAARAQSGEATICALQQEKIGALYKGRGDVEIYYLNYVLRADEATYNSDTGEATASGHFHLDGGPNDEHIQASHGTYNLTTETGNFYDVTGTTGFRFQGNRAILTSTAPFFFSGKMVAKTSPDHYLVYDGTITTCELPHPRWKFEARKVTVDVGGNASLHNSTFFLHGFPVFYFPYATHPVNREARQTGFAIPSPSRSSVNGTELGDSFYWNMNRSMDATIGAEYFSKRGWLQRGEFRALPSAASYIDLNYFGVTDRGIEIGTPTGPQLLREGGQEVRLLAQDTFDGFRAVSNVDYLSSFLFRLAFNDTFTQAINSEVKSQIFLQKDVDGLALSGMVERYQNFFQLAQLNGTLTNPPVFNDVQIWHAPSIDVSSVDQELWHTPLFWHFDASTAGLSRSEPGFSTNSILERLDFNPEISLPLQWRGWSFTPTVALHETYYTQRLADGKTVDESIRRQALDTAVELRPPALEKVFEGNFLGRTWKHVIEPEATYRYVTGVNDFSQILHFDEHDILSDTNEVEYGFTTRLYAKSTSNKKPACEMPMTGIVIGGPAPEQTVPWQQINNLTVRPCTPLPEVREVATWELFQKYFLDPTFGGALVPGQRNVFTTTEELTGIAFDTAARHLSPLVSRLRVVTSSHTDTEWDLDYDFRLGRINASTLLVNYNFGPLTIGGGDAFLQIPQTKNTSSVPAEGTCPAVTAGNQITCKFQQFRVALGYGSLTRRGFSGAASFGLDAEINQLQFASTQATYNWDCCGVTVEYRRYSLGSVRNENLFRFNFTLANIASFGNLRRQERLY
jgi:LPS-assembly protein